MTTHKKILGVIFLIVVGIGLTSLYYYSQKITNQQLSESVANSDKEVPHTMAALGDIACHAGAHKTTTTCHQAEVLNQIKNVKPEAVLLLGDLQYDKGELTNFHNVFGPLLGDLKTKSLPTPGNHEYETPSAAGYMGFWKDSSLFSKISQSYYSQNIGEWKIFALNSNCDKIGSCDDNSNEITWLKKELSQDNQQCSLAFWHHPVFTSGKYFDNSTERNRGRNLWQVLQDHSTDVVLNGHDHIYERFAKQRLDQTKDEAHGIRQFTVGTGGKVLYDIKGSEKNQEAIVGGKYGFLKLDLYNHYYRWAFIDESGKTLDSGTTACSF